MFRRSFFTFANSSGRSWRRTAAATKSSATGASSHFKDSAVPMRSSGESAKEQKIFWQRMNRWYQAKVSSGSEENILYKWGKLIRFDQPTGALLLVIPCYWGSAIAITKAIIFEGADVVAVQAPIIPIHLIGLFLIGAWTARSAACIVDSLWNRQGSSAAGVAVGSTPPVTKGQVSIMLGLHFLLGMAVVISLHPTAIAAAAAGVPVAFLYPVLKGIRYAPQLLAGMVSNWGVFVGYAAILGRIDFTVCVPLWVAGICWTFIYDTMYAYKDKTEGSTGAAPAGAVTFRGDPKKALYALCFPLFGGLGLAGVAAGQSFPFYIAASSFILHISSIIDHFNVQDPWSCLNAYKRNVRFGLYVLLSIFIGNFIWVLYSVVEGLNPNPKSNTATKILCNVLTLNVHLDRGYISAYQEFSWFDRLMKPAFVHAHLMHKQGVTEFDIPPYMRREYVAQNFCSVLRLTPWLFDAKMIDDWETWWCQTADHYTIFGKLV